MLRRNGCWISEIGGGRTLLVCLLFVAVATGTTARAQAELEGRWRIDVAESSAIDPWRVIELAIEARGTQVGIEETVSTGRRTHVGQWQFDTSKRRSVNWADWWVGNRHIGAFYGDGGKVVSQAKWLAEERTLRVESRFRLESGQGGSAVREHVEYRLSLDGRRLTRIVLRSTRDLPVVHVFRRVEGL